MKEFYSTDTSSLYSSEVDKFSLPETAMPGDSNSLKLTMDHWTGGALDMDLDVSYDGGATWHYGGGCKGAVSAEGGIEFHFTYQLNPTHIRGLFSSEHTVLSTLKLFSGV